MAKCQLIKRGANNHIFQVGKAVFSEKRLVPARLFPHNQALLTGMICTFSGRRKQVVLLPNPRYYKQGTTRGGNVSVPKYLSDAEKVK